MAETKESKKKSVKVAKTLVDLAPLMPYDDEAYTLLPNIMDLLMPIYDEKRTMERQPGRAFFGIDGWCFKMGLICPTEKAVFTFESDRLVGFIERFEEALRLKQVRPKPLSDWRKKNLLPTIDDLLK